MTNPTTYLPGSQDSIGWRNAGLLAIACALATGLALTASVISALAQPSPSSWPVLPETFESTGGGGWMITQYPSGGRWRSLQDRFRHTLTGWQRHLSGERSMDRDPARWRHLLRGRQVAHERWQRVRRDPFEVFIKDGVVRRTP